MVSVTLKISKDLKDMINKLPWINWSEMAREEAIKKIEEEQATKKFREIISKSNFTEEDAKELAEKIKLSMHKRLKNKGMV